MAPALVFDTENAYILLALFIKGFFISKVAVFTMKLEPERRTEFIAPTESVHRPASPVMRELLDPTSTPHIFYSGISKRH
jgi:hypothetical protein